MYKCKELNRDFDSKDELFRALRDNEKEIISAKKAQIYNSKAGESKGAIKVTPINNKIHDGVIKGIDFDDDYYYIAVNTTRILDSHEDVSIDGSWNKTAKEQQGKVYLVFNHDFDPTKTIVRKENIEILVATIPFAALNRPYEGETEALIYKFRKDKVISELAKDWLESGDDIEASVRLRYIKLVYAANSDAPEDKEFKKNFEKYYPMIANKDDFQEILYFYAILEQQNVLESSLVLAGSNGATGQITIDNAKNQPSQDTDDNQPEKSTEEKANEIKEVLNKLKSI